MKGYIYFIVIIVISLSCSDNESDDKRTLNFEPIFITELITVDEDGKPQARILAYFPPGDDWKIWLGTSTNSRKVAQVKNNPNAMFFFYDPKGRSYVSIAGKARVVSDSELKKKYWKEGWKVYYPDPETDYILIEVTPVRLEICSFKHKLYWDSTGKPAFVEF